MDAKSKKKDEHGHSGFASGSSRGDSSEKDSQDAPSQELADQKEKILREREQRKQDEREKIEKALQQIRFENHLARQKAKEKEAEMLRPSSGMKRSFGINPAAMANGEVVQTEEKSKKIEEQYGMEEDEEEEEEELEDIQEEIEEDENEEVKEELTLLKTKSLQMKTIREKITEQSQKIEEDITNLVGQPAKVTESIPESATEEAEEAEPEKKKEEDKEAKEDKSKIEGLLDYLASDSGEESEEEETKNSVVAENEMEEKRKLEERIKLLRQ